MWLEARFNYTEAGVARVGVDLWSVSNEIEESWKDGMAVRILDQNKYALGVATRHPTPTTAPSTFTLPRDLPSAPPISSRHRIPPSHPATASRHRNLP